MLKTIFDDHFYLLHQSNLRFSPTVKNNINYLFYGFFLDSKLNTMDGIAINIQYFNGPSICV